MAIRSAPRASDGGAAPAEEEAAGRWLLARDGLAVLSLALGALLGVVVFLPAEGRIALPLHEFLALLLGRASFVLPVALLALGGLTLLRSVVPEVVPPGSRVLGVCVFTVAALPAAHLVGLPDGGSLARAEAHEGAGLVGHWLGGLLLEWLGGPGTGVVLTALLLIGGLLAFDVTIAELVGSIRVWTRWCGRQVLRLARQGPWTTRAAGRRTEAAPTETAAPPTLALEPKTAPLENAQRSIIAPPQREPIVWALPKGERLRQNDLALRLGASPIRLEAPVPGKTMVSVEVPNSSVATVTLGDVLASAEWGAGHGLKLALGRDVSGKAVVGDLARMPHLLIAGATGSGKSVCINTIIASLLFQFTPDRLQLVMIDPKRVELVGFGELPHLRLPVITEMDRVVGALKWLVLEMDRRYTLFAQHGVRNLDAYNQCLDQARLPWLVVIVDELADMMMTTTADQVEKTLCRLAQLARATGIHLVVATQRPSVDVVTGLIKANFPTRVAFAVSSQTDSRVILDQAGAEKLLGRGDALFLPPEAMKPIRLQGAFVSDDEMVDLVSHWTAQGGPRYTDADLEQVAALGRGHDEDEDDGEGAEDVYDRACELAETVGRVSTSLLTRRLGIGQAHAQRLLARLVEEGVVEE